VGAATGRQIISGFQETYSFNDFSGWERKILVPQNVVSVHPSNILHIENFSGYPFYL